VFHFSFISPCATGLRQTRVGFSMDQSAKPSSPRDDWLYCQAPQGKMQGKILYKAYANISLSILRIVGRAVY